MTSPPDQSLWLTCPYLGRDVELTAERQGHIAQGHPDLWPSHRDRVVRVLADPDLVTCRPGVDNELIFSRWDDILLGGKHVVVIVHLDPPPPAPGKARAWVATAFITRRLAERQQLWRRET